MKQPWPVYFDSEIHFLYKLLQRCSAAAKNQGLSPKSAFSTANLRNNDITEVL